MQSRETVLLDVSIERDRQGHLKEAGKFAYTCADIGPTHAEKLAVLAEEFGEVSREVCEHVGACWKKEQDVLAGIPNQMESKRVVFLRKLRAELIQTAAVCVAWCEAIDKELDARGY